MQNHLCTFATVKNSWFRRSMLTAALTVGRILAKRLFIFGKLGKVASIHFARWIVFDDPGGRRILFLSNFDGSWANYLGDFSDLIGYGINAIWANVVGFTPTRFLLWGGAYDIQPYEDQVRRHFQPVRLIYRAYGTYSVGNLQRYLGFRDQLFQEITAEERREREHADAREPFDRRDLQGLLASGYDHLDHARFVFVRFGGEESPASRAAGRAWLRGVIGRVTTAERPHQGRHDACLNVAFSWAGLKALGLPQRLIDDSESGSLDGFPREFVAGMNRPEAAAILGDYEASASDRWQFGGPQHPPPHLLLLFYACDGNRLEELYQEVCLNHQAAHAGVEVIHRQDCVRARGDRSEPFGFRDGIAQPAVRGLTRHSTDRDPVALGEFVLGYRNEYGVATSLPSIGEQDDPDNLLWRHPDVRRQSLRAFGMNGTYLAFRKLSQNVAGFWRFVEQQTEERTGGLDPERMEYTAAKFMGRWRSGAPLVLAPARDVPVIGRDGRLNNDFGYTESDSNGLICPIGAHIRRANPRDSLPFAPLKSLQLVRRHRIIRRGRKYVEGNDGTVADQGICFIALNGDLLRQFEFIQHNWLNDSTFGNLDGDRDPVAGGGHANGSLTIQARPAPRRLSGLPRFVTVRGGGYFFMPGMKTLQFLAAAAPSNGATSPT
jgi:Dyp-type peroxidase family